MEANVPTQTAEGEIRAAPRRLRRATRARRDSDIVSDTFATITGGTRQTMAFASEQMRVRPLVVLSLLVATIGALVGVRVAQMQAMRRRKGFAERAMDTIGGIGSTLVQTISPRRGGPVETLRERGRGMWGMTREVRSAMVEGMPVVGRGRAGILERPESVTRQIGYALSLVPVAVALARNPLVRDIGYRYITRRITGR